MAIDYACYVKNQIHNPCMQLLETYLGDGTITGEKLCKQIEKNIDNLLEDNSKKDITTAELLEDLYAQQKYKQILDITQPKKTKKEESKKQQNHKLIVE